ncbi:unnamed protein product [Durusdinium trenchii]|uniref:Uncharacterized protein n=1 Tax=Durusdinium trenchii TaxID=1381693 RepID=A0ABP0NWA6_9DINO
MGETRFRSHREDDGYHGPRARMEGGTGEAQGGLVLPNSDVGSWKELDRAVLRLNERFDTMAKDIFSLKSNSITFQDQTSQQILDLKTTYSKHGQELQQLQNFRELRESWLETFEKRMVEVEDSVAYSEKVHVESSHALRVHLESLQAEVEDSLQEVCSVHADYGARVGKIELYLAKPFHCAPQAYGEPLAASEPQSTLRIPIPPKRGPTSQPDVAHEPRSISKNAQQQ